MGPNSERQIRVRIFCRVTKKYITVKKDFTCAGALKKHFKNKTVLDPLIDLCDIGNFVAHRNEEFSEQEYSYLIKIILEAFEQITLLDSIEVKVKDFFNEKQQKLLQDLKENGY